MLKVTLGACASAAVAAVPLVLAAPANAAPTAAALLVCGDRAVEVTGFGRGQVLHVEDSTEAFVVTRAEVAGSVVFDAPGQQGLADVVRCTTTSPISRTHFTFVGFFTPRTGARRA